MFSQRLPCNFDIAVQKPVNLSGLTTEKFPQLIQRQLSRLVHLSQAVVGVISVVYLMGTYSSPKAGALTGIYGRGPVLIGSTALMLVGILITAFSPVWAIFIGMVLVTGGFFAAHSVASGWIGRRARRAKGQASSLYLFSYYAGSSVAGTLGGYFWNSFGWYGITAFISLMLIVAIIVGYRLMRLAEARAVMV